MHQGRRPLTRRSGRVWAQAAAIVCVAVLGLGAVAVAAPKGDQGPPDQAKGNGPPPAPPRAGGNGQAKKAPAAGVTTQPAAGTHGKPAATRGSGGTRGSSGGHSNARANGTAQPAAGVTTGGQATGGGNAFARGHTGSGTGGHHASTQAKSGKVKLCHATGSGKHPYVDITVSANTVHAHERHPDARDIIPARRGCSAGASQAGGQEDGNAQPGTTSPPAGPHGRSVGPGDTPSGDGDTLGVSDESGGAPADGGGVLGADQGGGDDSGATAEASSASLPFTGLGLGLLVATGAMLALAGLYVRRRTA